MVGHNGAVNNTDCCLAEKLLIIPCTVCLNSFNVPVVAVGDFFVAGLFVAYVRAPRVVCNGIDIQRQNLLDTCGCDFIIPLAASGYRTIRPFSSTEGKKKEPLKRVRIVERF